MVYFFNLERASEYQIRDVNDELNTLLKVRTNWEERIRDLGGPDYIKSQAKTFDNNGREVPGNKGYKYFGRAKQLPGVKELFEAADAGVAPPKTRKDFYKNIDADYYGYRDEDDDLLISYEKDWAVGERERLNAKVLAHRANTITSDVAIVDDIRLNGIANGIVPEYSEIPTQKQIEEWLVNQRKQKLMDQYVL